MKITTIFTCLLVFATMTVGAQSISEHTLGLRLGDSDGFGAEISYQKSIGRYNRAEFNLGWRDSREFDAFKLAGVYQWVHNIDGDALCCYLKVKDERCSFCGRHVPSNVGGVYPTGTGYHRRECAERPHHFR